MHIQCVARDSDDAMTTEEWKALQREADLIEVALRAYQSARREVFDLGDSGLLHLSVRQSQVLAQLVVAEEDLRQFRVERSERLSHPNP